MLPKTRLALLLAAVSPCAAATAQELLQSPGVEVATSPPGWTLDEFASDPTITAVVDTARQAGFANFEEGGTLGIWLRPFVGAFIGNEQELTNAVLSQSVPAVPGETYTFSGYSQFETNYSGGTFGTPTTTTFELAFLDAGGSVIGAPNLLDLSTEQFNGFGWTQHTITAPAPAGTATARVMASALDMQPAEFNPQSAFLDTFSLTTSSAPTTELLENANFEIDASEPAGWVREVGEGTTARYEGFAARTGSNGFWIAPRSANAEPLDALFAQTVAATPGAEYEFSGWSFWETDYPGGVETLNADSPFGAIPSDTETYFFIEFLDASGGVLNSSLLDLRTVQSNDRTWREGGLSAVAPAGTVDVKVGVLAESLRSNRVGDPFDDAYFDDFSLMVSTGLTGDYNGDGVVDAADYTVWRDGLSPDSTQAGYDAWAGNFGATAGASAAVPEPSSLMAAWLAATFAACRVAGRHAEAARARAI
ncbi:hypothetical protein [Botrimarina sp.]|uniref:hypothetical protein n=1 Tax=Botrimarina sp. TaxID=2795802 RepID=UPI0032EFD557